MIAKCANPECDACFDHRIGGKFFRFHLTEAEMSVIPDATQNRHKVIHYWLCPICSKIFRLLHADTGKVALRRIAKEFEVAVYNVSDRLDHRKASQQGEFLRLTSAESANAGAAGIAMVLSSFSNTSLEDVFEAAARTPLWFLHPQGLPTPSKNRESPNDITAEVDLASLALFRDRLLLIATLAEILWLAIHLHRKREVIAHLLQGRTPPALVAIGVKCIA